MGGEAATTEVSPREQEEHSWLEVGKLTLAFPLVLLLVALVLATSPMLLWLCIWERTHSPAPGNATVDRMNSRECRDYARGYAKGVEDMNSYRRRAEEAEREVERLRRQMRDSQ